MAEWHGYIPIEKPAALSADEFAAVIAEIGAQWAVNPDSAQPSERPHWSFLEDGTAILEANFASEKIADATVRENAIADVINQLFPKYTKAAMRTAMRGKGVPLEMDKGREDSRQAALTYIEGKRGRAR